MRGFGIEFDLKTGASRRWHIGRDYIKRWADTHLPVNGEKLKSESEAKDERTPSVA